MMARSSVANLILFFSSGKKRGGRVLHVWWAFWVDRRVLNLELDLNVVFMQRGNHMSTASSWIRLRKPPNVVNTWLRLAGRFMRTWSLLDLHSNKVHSTVQHFANELNFFSKQLTSSTLNRFRMLLSVLKTNSSLWKRFSMFCRENWLNFLNNGQWKLKNDVTKIQFQWKLFWLFIGRGDDIFSGGVPN